MKDLVETCSKWLIVYTYPKAERKVRNTITQLGIESFLPLMKVIRQWSDRKKKLEVPLFPNYVFVKIDPNKRFELLKIHGLVRFVTFDGRPAEITDDKIDSMKRIVSGDSAIRMEQFDNCQIGSKMRIVHGHFSGIEGYLLREYGNNRFVIQVDILKKAVSIDIPADYIDALT
jgi:transcription antitermination factor NusG